MKVIQYISQGDTVSEQINNIRSACEAGVRWVQLRYKNARCEELMDAALKARNICQSFDAVYIINDDVSLAAQLNAHGVHLGLNDMSVSEARKILGPRSIIGGTANTIEDILLHKKDGTDYIGLGPFKFTKTKDKLSPVLGLDGLSKIMHYCHMHNIEIPIFAIGGIQASDLKELAETGIRGIAVSSLLSHGPNASEIIKSALNTFNYVKT